MSPSVTRQDARRAAASNSKPYARSVDNGSLTSPTTLTTPEAFQHVTTAPSFLDHPGFPTHDQYKCLEATYLSSLHSRKRNKALISQAMFDRIWDTLLEPDVHQESPQFRFWVRKMFSLSGPPKYLSSTGLPTEAIRPVLLHDNRPVAIQEQIYDIICSCHSRAEHGGRDKTRAVIREHYSWVPKELVSKFVKACPTCILKKCGNSALVAIVEQPKSVSGSDSQETSTNLEVAKSTHPLPSTKPLGMSKQPESHPMSREISLYQGLPNGWQYDSEYPEARETYLNGNGHTGDTAPPDAHKRAKRPRVPSVVPLGNVSHAADCENKENQPHCGADQGITLPSLREALSADTFLDNSITMTPIQPTSQGLLPSSLQRLQLFLPVSETEADDHLQRMLQTYSPLPQERNDTTFRLLYSGDRFCGEMSPLASPSSADRAPRVEVNNAESLSDENAVSSTLSTRVTISGETPTKFQTSRRTTLPPLDLNTVHPLRSLQSFQHLLDCKSSESALPQDGSPLYPFSPRGYSRSASSTGSCFSVFFTPPISSGEPSPLTPAVPSPSQEHFKMTIEQGLSTQIPTSSTYLS